jgi:two-component system chemotaxis response regulator CheB
MTAKAGPIRAVVVEEDSPHRAHLERVLEHDRDIAVLGHANNLADAQAMVARTRPDVIVLDLHLGDGDGQATIEQVMAHTPTPILVLTNRIEDRQSPSAVHALVAGALEAMPRPSQWTPELGAQLRRIVRQISKVQVIRHPRGSRIKPPRRGSDTRPTKRPIVAVAASTGGPSALATLLADLGGLPAAVLLVQHLHPDFTSGLLEWMVRVSALPVETAQHDQIPRPGHVYLAPGGLHLRLSAEQRLELHSTPESVHRPSADQLFESVALQGPAAIGVLLTGMGDDGARGLLAIHRAGGRTLAQDEASCAVFGMPRAAQRLGAVTDLLPLSDIAHAIKRAVREVMA